MRVSDDKKVQHWIDRAFWALLSAVALYVGSQMEKLSTSVNELNIKLSVYIQKSDLQAKSLDDHEARIRSLEVKKN